MMHPVLLAAGLVATLVSFAPGSAVVGSTDGFGKAQNVIVVLNSGVDSAAAAQHASAQGAVVRFVYGTVLGGYAGRLPSSLIAQLRTDPHVNSIVPDAIVQKAGVIDPGVSWGLDRIDQRTLPLDGQYFYPPSAGDGVTAYIIDTGIDTDNTDFGGRASFGADFVDDTNMDCNGHGTAMASIVGGTNYGVAKLVNLVAVRVLNCDGVGSVSQVIAGINWAVQQYQARKRPSVAVMGFETSANPALDNAVTAATRAGLDMIVAAGDDNDNACNYSPSGGSEVVTVAASNIDDERAHFSNIGPCITLFAPGVHVQSDWPDGQTKTVSGTSFSAAYTAGVAALVVGENPTFSFGQLKAFLVSQATPDQVTGTAGGCNRGGHHCVPPTPNSMVFNGCGPSPNDCVLQPPLLSR